MTTYTDTQLRNLFQSPFNPDSWQKLLQNFFGATELRRTPEKLDAQDIGQGYYLGCIDTSDSFRIGLFRYDIAKGSVANKRVGLRNLVRTYINQRYGSFDAALAVFDSGDHWRLSFICDIKDEATSPKRFTYVFGNSELLYKTAVERFRYMQKEGISFKSMKTAFSVEALSDEFFDRYREQYADFIQFITGKRFEKSGNKWVEKVKGEPDKAMMDAFGGDEKKIRNYVKKMMGRITFLHFLQRKGWMNGDLNYMQHLFERSPYQDDYLDSVLEPLFFGILNTKPDGREAVFDKFGWDKALLAEWKDIPYLNGGLFERDADDEPKSVFPAEYFRRLFQFFSEYNFTIDENDPNDAVIGVDPEMLGKIFENLLEDNKDKGAFYTPKEIVRYMCQESLIAYLDNETSIPEDKIRRFVLSPEDGVSDIPEAKRAKLLAALENVKICDPAIGSGAFPMGLLNELLRCRETLAGEHYDRVAIKKSIIYNNIYGVDIEKGAVDIARLRFWLSIVVDEETPSPLPNLDYKIMQGNSLLESFHGVDLSKLTYEKNGHKDKGEISLFDSETNKLQKTVSQLLAAYYSCSDHDKKTALQQRISDTINKQLEVQAIDENILAQLRQINLAGNDQFFLWHTWFSDVFNCENGKSGFDIVIGNPPYVSVKSIPEDLKKIYTNYFTTAKGRFNLFILFIELFYNISKISGVINLIIPEGIYSNIEYRFTRALLLEKCSIIKLCTFTKRVFEASVDTTIIIASRKKLIDDNVFLIDVDVKRTNNFSSQLEVMKYPYYIIPAKLTDRNKLIVEKLMLSNYYERIQKILEIQQGIIYSGQPKENVFADYVKDATYKPILDGRDINRWMINWDIKEYDKYLSYTNKLHRPREERLFVADKKILFPRRATKIMATIDTDQFYVLNTAYIGLMKNAAFQMEYILGILNSRLIEYLYNQLFMGWQITIPAIESLPVARISYKQQCDIARLVTNMIKQKKSDKYFDVKDEENQLNSFIYEAFGLNSNEIRTIEESKVGL